VARALIVGCGCRGREVGRGLVTRGWLVRGTSRSPSGRDAISDAGLEAVEADPDRIGTVIDQLEGVSIVFWLLGSVQGASEDVTALHGARLERLLEEIVDTPVRGLVYEAGGSTPAADRQRGEAAVRAAADRWRIPVEVVAADPNPIVHWRDAMLIAADRLTGL
jgi:uncharacterized protein YbjT (DUF2867 family)